MTIAQSSFIADESGKFHVIASSFVGIIPFPWISFASLSAVQLNML
jgi:hypothetical protein